MELRDRNMEIYLLRQENEKLKKRDSSFSIENFKENNAHLNFFTGLPNIATFLWILSLLTRTDDVKLCLSRLSKENHLLIILMKLRLGLLNKDIAFRFSVCQSVISRVLRNWLPNLATCLQPLIKWPNKCVIRSNLPECFKKKFRDCVCIIDCYEIFIERPSNLTTRAQSWSNYKHNNTIKYLIGISPTGAITFLSGGWGGRVSDKELTNQLSFLKYINFGDCILADRGFLIKDKLAEKGANLYIPAFLKGK
ncbi:uncharacterized protein LOC124814044 isoform X1 [Hydra vulgaris]|uniref:uncharacterized protein LOC124814044 isoform X1 n=1 Tax=Hydra vulgaris TaxID=6087 RepID=UPI001F5EB614|nr:uncharacterized protein LOC124814044 [Hydra vulgaris]